jgi:hypothetical protein
MRNNNRSGNTGRTDCKYHQPLTEQEREWYLKNPQDGKRIQQCLNDEWSNLKIRRLEEPTKIIDNPTRRDVIRKIVDDLMWLDDCNHEDWIHEKLNDSDLFQKLDNKKEDLDSIIESVNEKRNNRHYSEYRDARSEKSNPLEDSENQNTKVESREDSTTEQNPEDVISKLSNPLDDRKERVRNMFNDADF